VYAAKHTRAELGAQLVEAVLERIVGRDTGPVLQAFVDLAARTDAANLDRLERLIAEKRKAGR
jgi:predicted transcriptional regulator